MYIRPNLGKWGIPNGDSDTKLFVKDHIVSADLSAKKVPGGKKLSAIVGFECDVGVRRNKGRPGAKDAPNIIRRELGRMAWHGPKDFLLDAGNENCPDERMEDSQLEFSDMVIRLLAKGHFTIGIGGGHEIAIASHRSVRKTFPKGTNIGIINFDAHFDMRSTEKDLPNSGTSFYQIAKSCKRRNVPFNYFCLGIQEFSNSKLLFQTATKNKVRWLESREITYSGIKRAKNGLHKFIDACDVIYLSVCMDVFNSAFAPGVSAVNPVGLEPAVVLELIEEIMGTKKVVYCDIAEVNPEFDIDNRTAKLAASIIYDILKWNYS